MPPENCQPTLKLSICITTLNRAAFIGATLESILPQLAIECEIVILDGGSTDDTSRVVSESMRSCDRMRYFRVNANNGFDRDCNCVVELANGEYCWLMTDDDLLKPGAVEAVLVGLRQDPSMIIVNAEAKSFCMTKLLQPRILDFPANRVYGPDEMDCLVQDTGAILRFIGCLVIKRSIWLSRDKERYYGSLFVNVGVVFQQRLPGETLVIAMPLISYRTGNSHAFSPRMFETFMVNLPSLVWSLPLSDEAKREICGKEPWKNLRRLLWWRGLGYYSLSEYRRLIRPRLVSIREALGPFLVALLPGVLVNGLFVTYYSITRRRRRGVWQADVLLQSLRESRFCVYNWRLPRLARRP